jgi:hypothetical protein
MNGLIRFSIAIVSALAGCVVYDDHPYPYSPFTGTITPFLQPTTPTRLMISTSMGVLADMIVIAAITTETGITTIKKTETTLSTTIWATVTMAAATMPTRTGIEFTVR